MSHLSHTKNVIRLAQWRNSLRTVGRPICSIRSFQAGQRSRFRQAVLNSKAGMDGSALAVHKIHSLDFSIFTGNKSIKDGMDTEATAVIASLNSPELSGPNSPIKIQETPGKGYGVFATRSIPAGTIILAETPLVKSSTGSQLAAEISCDLLSPQEQAYFKLLKGIRQASETDSPTMLIWNTNHFDISREGVGCLYAKASMLNHSCEPNAEYTFTNEKHIVIGATRDIELGEEVTISYVGPDIQKMAVEERKSAVLERSGFQCQCDACVSGRRLMGVLDPRQSLMNGNQPYPTERLSDLSIFNVSDELSRRGAIEAHKLVDQWTADFRKRNEYWQIIMNGHARTEGDTGTFTPEMVQWMQTHVVRTHTQWLAGNLPNHQSRNKSRDNLTIDLGSTEYVVPENILIPYLDRMALRAKHCLLHGSARGVGILALQKRFRDMPAIEHDLSFECGEIVRGVADVVGGMTSVEVLDLSEGKLEDFGMEKKERQCALMDAVVEMHMDAGFGTGFFKK